ncbi:MAG: GAF domain-containing protein [Candidatus Eremiobacteraeota bacterium]|nr:GAF domain-containing protein [Candidatus Eremiobacteraeota bacterium]MCW5868695.1 GAF domain-containing protein [Candidatus Eremiobacteraeota bacterium]
MTTRLNNLGSILGSFLVMCLFGVALAHNFAFIGYKLHPFLLCIAAAAIGYGLIEALFAFVVAVAIYFLGLLVYHHDMLPAADPHVYIIFSFVVTAVVLGMVQNSRFRQLLQTRSELEEVRNEGERLRQRLQVVNTANQKLNERILGEVTTVQSFADIARRLSVLEEKDLYAALCDLMVDFVHAQEASVYMLQGERLTLMAEKGWESVPQEARALVRDRDLLWSALDQRKVVTPLDLEKMPGQTVLDAARRHRRLICAPIFHPQSGEATGVLSVDRLPFAHLHGNTLGMLGVIAKWAGDSLFNASSFQELSRQLVSDELIPGCIPPILLQDRFQQKPGQALVVCQLQGLKGLEYADQVWFRKTLSAALQPLAGGGASIGRAGEEAYALLLPDAGSAAAASEQLVNTLRTKVQGHPQAARLSIFIGSALGDSYESAWQQALKSAQRC